LGDQVGGGRKGEAVFFGEGSGPVFSEHKIANLQKEEWRWGIEVHDPGL
jgi:hypothetical protein